MEAKYKVGERVCITTNTSESENPIGSIGKITSIYRGKDYIHYRVVVKGYTDDNLANWQGEDELSPIK
jgi:hypothetical protein